MLHEIEWLRPHLRFLPFAICVLVAVVSFVLWTAGEGNVSLWIFLAALILTGLGVFDLFQAKHNLMRNYPVSARLRWIFEGIRPQIRQYFIESNIDGTPFNNNERTLVYERAKNLHAEEPFGDGAQRLCRRLRVFPSLDGARAPGRRAFPGRDRRAGLQTALFHGLAQRLGHEFRRPQRQRHSCAEPGRQAGRLRPRHRRRGA